MSMEQWWNDTDRGKLKYWEKNLSQCPFGTTNPIWTTLGLIADLRGDRQATDRLAMGRTQLVCRF